MKAQRQNSATRLDTRKLHHQAKPFFVQVLECITLITQVVLGLGIMWTITLIALPLIGLARLYTSTARSLARLRTR